MNGLRFFQSPDLNHWTVTQRLWLWSLVNHVTCKGFLSISLPFSFKMPVYTCANKPWKIYVSAPWIWPRCKKKKNISPQNSPSAGGWFWYFGLGPILLCSRPGAIPFSVVFLCLTPAENAQMRSVRLFGEDFHQTDPGEFHPVRINQTSPWKSDTPQGDPGDLCLKFPRGTNSGSLISPADSQQIIHGVGVRFIFYMNPLNKKISQHFQWVLTWDPTFFTPDFKGSSYGTQTL